ncbi:c-type cytochrome biogenesis protein CcmI [Pseudoalteromonas sp. BDTF-M6]|uniref:c-type cytochrome biogenesis protein CcmI n=1 Tax=Pseudoalteromonas sp. BDTF-M6 TaxID=2796132 RepID=UPI001BAFD34F|nr:c-type cytochrome biogenesis protein CcmI [Pseudoalteromonas sp. BDTF-M6]MBS3798846.1 c-type cytochrome biogenesis protein CcmI [Pseudoalteromonas sp. BDTF-M6]
MLSLWGAFAALAIAALVFVCWPFFRRFESDVNPSVNAERIDIFEQRQQELADDLALGRISQTSFDESLLELKRRLLNDLAPEQQLQSRGNNRILALTGTAFLVLLSAVFYYFTGNQAQLKAWEQAMVELPELGERAVMGKGEPLDANERQALLLGLRTRLAQDGDDAVAWLMLGRVAMTLNDYEMAMQAFDKVLAMDPENLSAKVSYAQSLLIKGDEMAMNQAAKLLSQVLQVQPQNIDAISMLALIAYERKDWTEAKSAFELILATMTEQDPRYAMVSERIAEIDSRLAQEQNSEPTHQVQVQVTLAEEIANRIPHNAVLFVFAKAAEGPAMPLAVKRFEQFSLPMSVTLSEADAMMAQLSLQQFEQIQVIARISKDGDVAVALGELEGKSQPFNRLQQPSVNVTIDTLIQ